MKPFLYAFLATTTIGVGWVVWNSKEESALKPGEIRRSNTALGEFRSNALQVGYTPRVIRLTEAGGTAARGSP